MTFDYCKNCGNTLSSSHSRYRYTDEKHCLCKKCRTGKSCPNCESAVGAREGAMRSEVTIPTCVNPYCDKEDLRGEVEVPHV